MAWSKTNWPKFCSVLIEERGLCFDVLTSPREVERAAANYTAALHSAIAEAVPQINPRRSKRPRGWWNTELDRMSQTVKCLQDRARQNPTDTSLAAEARAARNSRRNAVRAAEQGYLMLKLQATSQAEVWKVLKGAQPAHTRAIPDLNGPNVPNGLNGPNGPNGPNGLNGLNGPNGLNGQTSMKFTEKCAALRNALFPPPTAGDDIPALRPPNMDMRTEFSEITSAEVTRAISRCNKRSASGQDRVPYSVIEKAHRHLPALLPDLFTASIRTGHFPGAWKHANCVVIPRGGRRDPSVPKSYHPISLLSNISKVLEKLIAKRTADAALRVGALSNTQFGAVENRSAIDALFAILHPTSDALATPAGSKKIRPDRPTFLANDIQGAFNNTDPARLVKIMETRCMPRYLTRWTSSFTADRTMSFCFDNSKEPPQPYDSGLPQGSPVSPVLFLIYAQAMLEAPSYFKDIDVSYMDDNGALQLATTQTFAIRRLQERMELRLQRGAQLNLPYDLGKAGLIHIWPLYSSKRPADATSQPPITMENKVAKPSASISAWESTSTTRSHSMPIPMRQPREGTSALDSCLPSATDTEDCQPT